MLVNTSTIWSIWRFPDEESLNIKLPIKAIRQLLTGVFVLFFNPHHHPAVFLYSSSLPCFVLPLLTNQTIFATSFLLPSTDFSQTMLSPPSYPSFAVGVHLLLKQQSIIWAFHREGALDIEPRPKHIHTFTMTWRIFVTWGCTGCYMCICVVYEITNLPCTLGWLETEKVGQKH